MSIVASDRHEPITPEQWIELRETWPSAERLAVAMRLALDVDACAALLAGDPVDPARLDKTGLAWAGEQRLVRLVRPIDLLLAGDAA